MVNNNFKLVVDKRCHECDLDKDELITLFNRGITLLKSDLPSGDHTLKVFFVTDEEIRIINRNYREIDKSTDVISLSYLDKEPFPGENLIGEIFISVDTSKKQANENNLSLKDETEFLFVHGFLHIIGYDHKNKEDRQKMFDLQDKILGSKRVRATIGY